MPSHYILRLWYRTLWILILLVCVILITSTNQGWGTNSTSIIKPIVYEGRSAFRLSDGKTEAVVVPEIGRVMRYGFVGEFNFLWNAPKKTYGKNEWKNWGGDKTWPAPQMWWPVMSGRDWPPNMTWDGSSHKARILATDRLQTTSEVAPSFGARVVREYWFEKNGNFVIRQIVEKVRGKPLFLSIWNVTQIVPSDAIFVPLNPQSIYKQNFHWLTPAKNDSPVVYMTPTLLQLHPTADNSFKIGADGLCSDLAAVKNGVAMIEHAPHLPGNYPDGAVGSGGFPVEVYHVGDPNSFYSELELLSPLRFLRKGDRSEQTIRWSLHRLPSKDVNAEVTRVAVEKLLQG